MNFNKLFPVWLMVGLLVLAACSSTPKVVETQPNPNTISPEIRAQIEANPEFQLVARLAAQEGKQVTWAQAFQSEDAKRRTVVQLPLWRDKQEIGLVIVVVEHQQVTSVLLSRTSLSPMGEANLAFTDLTTKVAVVGTIKTDVSKPIFQQMVWGPIKKASSLEELLHPEEIKNLSSVAVTPSSLCSGLWQQLNAAAIALTIATQALFANCWATWWAPNCWVAAAAYAAALLNYYGILEQARSTGCL